MRLPRPSSFAGWRWGVTRTACRHPARDRAARRGFTLVELLIVVAILVVVAAFLIPSVKPALEDRKIREAARLTNVFFTAAQARAIERGRPVGVWLERNPNSPNECIQLFMAEVPLPYSGDLLGARAALDGAGGFGTVGTATFDASSASLPSLVRVGDRIKFDYRGAYYTILTVPPAGTPAPFQVTFTHPSAPPPRGITGAAYQILRTPGRNSATTMALPTKTAINLFFSGAGAGGTQFAASGAADTTPVLITFSPAGRLDRVFLQGTNAQATESVYLFVARTDKDLPDGSPNIVGPQNLEDMSNLWIAVGHRTGSVGTIDNVNTFGLPMSNAVELAAKVAESRRFAREKTTMGGR